MSKASISYILPLDIIAAGWSIFHLLFGPGVKTHLVETDIRGIMEVTGSVESQLQLGHPEPELRVKTQKVSVHEAENITIFRFTLTYIA